MKRQETVPSLVRFNVECDGLKNSFPIVVSDDEGADYSSDEEESTSAADNCELSDDAFTNTTAELTTLLPPPTAVDFPVAPSSPEIRENDCAFSFIERVSFQIL